MSEEAVAGEVIALPSGRSWDMLPDEPSDWFTRFEKYRLMQPEDRTTKAARLVEYARRKRLNTLDKLPSLATYNANARKYRWRERARDSDKQTIENSRSIDELVKQELSRSAEEERAIQRSQRRQLLTNLYTKVEKAIASNSFDLTTAKNTELLQFARLYLQQNREEYDVIPSKVAKFQYNTLTDQELYDLIKERINTISEPVR